MSTQLNVSSFMDVEALNCLAGEFKEQFRISSELIHERIAGRRFVFNRDGKDTYPYDEWDESASGEVVPIIPAVDNSTIASGDSSCILLGETSDGAVYAVRAAVCFSSKGAMRGYLRIGPLVILLSPKGACGLPTQLGKYELKVALSDHMIAERIIRNTVEKRILTSLLNFSQRMIVVADGSLKHPLDTFPDSMFRSGASRSTLVGFSKSSGMISASAGSAAVSRAKGPAFTTIEQGPIETVVAKFSRDGLVFRLDVAKSERKTPQILGEILSNDGFAAGYPESLRVAHHLSVFSRSEDMALKAYISNRYSLRHLRSFALRRIALGGMSNSG